METRSGNKGFTLIELIATLVILGILATTITLGFSEVMEGFLIAEEHSDMIQEVQVALNRMHIELQHVNRVTSSSGTSISYHPRFTFDEGELAESTLSYTGTQITLDNDVLLDGVTDFDIIYLDQPTVTGNTTSQFNDDTTVLFEIRMTVEGADTGGGPPVTRTFVTRIPPTIWLSS